MDNITPKNIHLFNENVRYEEPLEIISFALEYAKRPILTTSFGPYSASILYAVTRMKPDIQVIWCDTGFNTQATYKHAKDLMKKLKLKIEIFTPKFTTAYLNAFIGEPTLENPDHAEFSKVVKLDPFDKAFDKYQPDVWFTNIRKHQTSYRELLDVFSFSSEGILKVSPFFHYDDDQLKNYMVSKNLPMEFDYYDPVKAMDNRECGIHLNH